MKHPKLWALAFALGGAAAASVTPAGEESIKLAAGPGRDLTSASCAMCHSLDYIEMNAPVMSRAAWERTVQKMIDRFGAPLEKSSAQQVIEYLAAHYSAGEPAGK